MRHYEAVASSSACLLTYLAWPGQTPPRRRPGAGSSILRQAQDEGAHAWLNRFRSALIRSPKKAENYRAFVHFACAIIPARQCLTG